MPTRIKSDHRLRDEPGFTELLLSHLLPFTLREFSTSLSANSYRAHPMEPIGAPALALGHWYQQVRYLQEEDASPTNDASPLRGHASPSFGSSVLPPTATLLLNPPELLQPSNVITAVFLAAFLALLLRILDNRKVPRYLPRRIDVLTLSKILLSVIYAAGTVAMLVYARKDGSEVALLFSAVVTAVSARFDLSGILSVHYRSPSPGLRYRSTTILLHPVLSLPFTP
jgi:hypothetical protein